MGMWLSNNYRSDCLISRCVTCIFLNPEHAHACMRFVYLQCTYVSYTLRLCDIQLPMCIPRNASISSDASFKTVEKQCGRDHNRMEVPEVCDFEGELCNNLIPGLRYLDMFLLTLQADNYRQSSRHHYPAMHPSTLTLIITNSVQPRRVYFFNICICTNLGSFHNANCRIYIGHKMIKLCSGEVNIHLRDSYHPAARSVN